MERLGGDRAFLAELAALFEESYPGQMAQMREAVADADAPALRHTAHALKGAALSLQAAAVAEAARRLEEMGRSGDLADAAGALDVLERDLHRLRASLRDFVAGQGGSA